MTPASKSTFVLGHRHLLGIEGLSAADITGLLDLMPGTPALVMQTAVPIASKGNATDEAEMDAINVAAYALNSTTIRCYWQASSIVVGTYAFAYITT